MGNIRPLFIKRIARNLLEKYRDRFNNDFEHNKKVVMEILDLPSKRVANHIAGYLTRLLEAKE